MSTKSGQVHKGHLVSVPISSLRSCPYQSLRPARAAVPKLRVGPSCIRHHTSGLLRPIWLKRWDADTNGGNGHQRLSPKVQLQRSSGSRSDQFTPFVSVPIVTTGPSGSSQAAGRTERHTPSHFGPPPPDLVVTMGCGDQRRQRTPTDLTEGPTPRVIWFPFRSVHSVRVRTNRYDRPERQFPSCICHHTSEHED
jgi:hypothetical protein